MHGGIGRSINSVEQIEKLERPITMDAGSIVLMDLLWYILLLSPYSAHISNSVLCFSCFCLGRIPLKMIVLRA